MRSGRRSDVVTIPRLSAQVLFDALVHSMDFGSGFLDTEEVRALREMAVVLGVDPASATPSEFVKDFPHTFVAMDSDELHHYLLNAIREVGTAAARVGIEIPCGVGVYGRSVCGRPADHEIHQVQQ